MPTDENNGVTPQQNQLGNPNLQGNGNPVNQDLGNVSTDNTGSSDDFDFSFNTSDTESPVDVGVDSISQNMQNQVTDQGRTGMFQTPDEQLESSQQVGLDNNPQVGPDNNPQVGLDSNSFDNNSEAVNPEAVGGDFDDSNYSNSVGDEDAYLADIAPEDTTDSVESTETTDDSFVQKEEESPVVLDKEIQDMISFDGPAGEPANQSGSDGDSDDWLAQEDKKVEETFGVENVGDTNKFPDVNMSSDTVAQSVENLMTEEKNNQYIPNEQEFSQMSDLLNSSSTGQVDFNNVNNQTNNVDNQTQTVNMGGDMGNAQGMFGSVDVQPEQNAGTFNMDNNVEAQQTMNFQPSVDNQTQTVNMGGDMGNTQGMFGSVDVQPEQNAGTFNMDNNVETQQTMNFQPSVDNQTVNIGGDMGNTQGMFGSVDVQPEQNAGTFNMDNNVETQQTMNFQPSVDNQTVNMGGDMGNTQGMFGSVNVQPEQNVGTFDISKIDAGNVSDGAQSFGLNGVGSMAQDNYGENGVNESETQNYGPDNSLNLDTIDDDIQNLNVGGQAQFNVDQNQVVQNGQQVVGQNVIVKKRKKQSGFVVLGVALVAIIAVAFVLYKMFPDKFNMDMFNKGGKVAEYTDNSGVANVGDDEQNLGEGGEENEANLGEENLGEENNIGEENTLEESSVSGENVGEVSDIDPNSLAALLENDGSENITELTGDVVEGDLTGDNEIVEQNQNPEDFDPFAQVGELFDENTKNSDALKNYISKGEFYKNLGAEKSNPTMSKYGEYIMVTAQKELTKLENGEEIDTTLFNKFDELLEKVSSLSD